MMIKKTLSYGLVLIFCFTCGCSDSHLLKKWTGRKGAAKTTEVVKEKVKKPRYVKPPSISTEPVITTDKIEEDLAQAQKYLKKKQYENIPPLTEPILANSPDAAAEDTKKGLAETSPDSSAIREARALNNAAYYQMGLELYKENKYLQSLDRLGHVDPDYKNTATLLIAVRQEMKMHADVLYKQGVKYFINEELSKAIANWKQVLVLNPDHPKAKQDIEDAEDLLKKLKKIQ